MTLPPRTNYQATSEDYERAFLLWRVLVTMYARDELEHEAFHRLRLAYLMARRALNIYTNHVRYDLYGGIPATQIC